MFSDLFFRFRALLRRSAVEAELEEELGAHFEKQIEKCIGLGATREEATRRARIEFGGLDQTKEQCRDARGVSLLENLLQDVRFGVRMLRKSPGFTAIAVLTFALGIGASTAVFSVVNTILLKPLPYPHSERIVLPWRLAPIQTDFADSFPWTKREFVSFAQQSKTFQYLGGFMPDSFNLTGSGEPARLDGIRASVGFFPALGVTPLIGRTFTAAEDQPGNEHEVVLGHKLWSDRFGSDPHILGKAIELNGYAYTVIGVMPAGFAFPHGQEMPASLDCPREAQLWVPLAVAAAPRGPNELGVLGRMKPGVTFDQAQAELDIFANWEDSQFPEGKGWHNSRVKSLDRQVAGDTRRPLLLILGAVGLVLLIASSNVASLLLTRSLGRRREFTLRSALGAGRGRMVRQLLTESLLLAAAGSLVGILLAQATIDFLKILGPADIPRLSEVALDLRVFLFTFGVTLVSGMLFGLTPAIGATREGLIGALKEGGNRSGGSAAHPKTRNALLVVQVALALVLVISAGLLIKTFYSLLGANAGFNPTRVLTFQLSLPSGKYNDTDRMARVYQRVLQQLQSTPRVHFAGLESFVPFGGATDSTVIRIPDHPPFDNKERPYANYSFASPGYFSAVGTPLLQGRDFLESDTSSAPLVTIINRAMARKYWPGQDPIGRQVGVADKRWKTRTIVGVVADTKRLSLREEPTAEMYVPYTQNEIKIWPSMQTMQVALRTDADPAAIVGSVREAVRSVDPDLPLAKIATLTTLVDESMAQARFSMLLLGAFGGLAVALAAVGMYGVISYSVSQRTQEIGIRMALGAERGSVFTMVLGQGARLAGMGVGIGIAAAFGATHMMSSYLYGVGATDPLTFAAVSLLLGAIALLACYLPARRATRVDPMIALRYE